MYSSPKPAPLLLASLSLLRAVGATHSPTRNPGPLIRTKKSIRLNKRRCLPYSSAPVSINLYTPQAVIREAVV